MPQLLIDYDLLERLFLAKLIKPNLEFMLRDLILIPDMDIVEILTIQIIILVDHLQEVELL
jgi:hypothetical protein